MLVMCAVLACAWTTDVGHYNFEKAEIVTVMKHWLLSIGASAQSTGDSNQSQLLEENKLWHA
jgi:hypothetical protein